MKQRIWELGALRGSCVLGMVLVHLVYDAVELYGLIDWEYPPFFHLVKEYGGILFILISGICASFGSRPALQGATILACGLLCTLVTFSLEALGFLGSHSTIWFGILHCLGCSMLLWSFLRRLPAAVWAILGGIFAITGHFLLKTRSVSHPWLVFLGFIPQWFASPDYFPLLPFFGYFLLGAAAGRVLYPTRRSLLPGVRQDVPLLRFLRYWGTHSLLIYLLHQPILMGLCALLSALL